MMCWDGLTVEQGARIGMGIGLFAGGVVLVCVLVWQGWLACRGGGAGVEGERDGITRRRGGAEEVDNG